MTTTFGDRLIAIREKALNDIFDEMRMCDMLTFEEEVNLSNARVQATSLEMEGDDIIVYAGEQKYKSIHQLNIIDLCSIADAVNS